MILSFAPLFYSFPNPVVHEMYLTFSNHTMDIKFKISNSLLFLFGRILVITI
jgi:hypothetical protein